ncbi:MAG: hypothetical protein WCD27_14690, partial [Candidatus Acidiferrales bacterium]
MDPSKRAGVEAWLRYGEELGLGPYYRGRTAASAAVESTEACESARGESRADAPVAMAAAASSREIAAPASGG